VQEDQLCNRRVPDFSEVRSVQTNGCQSTEHLGRQALHTRTSNPAFSLQFFGYALCSLSNNVTLASHQYLRLTLHLPKSVNPVRYWYECCRSGIIVTAVKIAMKHGLQYSPNCCHRHDALSTAVAILSRSP
jgi:hypothetical protein